MLKRNDESRPLCDAVPAGQPVHHHHSVNLVLNSKQEQAIANHSLVRILVVEDFAPWRHFIIAKLSENHDMRIAGVVSDGLEAALKAEELQPDVILLNVGLPKMNGIEAARRIRKVAPKSKILFLTQEIDIEVARVALSDGHGYVVKSDAGNELFAAIEAVMQGKKFVSSTLASPAFMEYIDSQATAQLSREEAIASPAAAPPLVRREVGRCHEVQIYSDDSLFLDGFTRFLGAALKTGGPAVFIGTASHRNMLLGRLHAESPDTRAAIRQGRYVALDAAEFLSNFMVSDMPDTGWFLKAVDDLIVAATKEAHGEHLRVAACGECAPMLWAQGKADAAIRLEELWNEVTKTYNVDILCGYSLESLRCEEDSYTFRRICEEHSAIRG
ncbi:MAG: response regulator [Candidatus Acidiferrales bacterium]